MLEQGTVDILGAMGAGDRMRHEGLVHDGVELRFGGRSHRIDFAGLTGKSIVIYGQHEVVKDLVAARVASGEPLLFDVQNVSVHDIDSGKPSIRFTSPGEAEQTIDCDFIAGCDGFHGICRSAIPAGVLDVFERTYPFAWLGILSKSPPLAHELLYTNHPRGFALFSARSAEISRAYLQCAPDEDIAEWPDDRIWQELRARLEGVEEPPELIEGDVLQKGVTAMRSFVVEPMQYKQLFLAGDAAHIVPPTGAKGMNLAVSDVNVLANAMKSYYANGDRSLLDRYSEICLRRVWKAQRFSWWMTSMLHQFSDQSAYDRRVQLAELDYVTSSRAASQGLAENYVGLPIEGGLV